MILILVATVANTPLLLSQEMAGLHSILSLEF